MVKSAHLLGQVVALLLERAVFLVEPLRLLRQRLAALLRRLVGAHRLRQTQAQLFVRLQNAVVLVALRLDLGRLLVDLRLDLLQVELQLAVLPLGAPQLLRRRKVPFLFMEEDM